jgi:hypothetical protein
MAADFVFDGAVTRRTGVMVIEKCFETWRLRSRQRFYCAARAFGRCLAP